MSDEIFARLAAPFPVDKVSWRTGATNKKKRQRDTKDQYAKATQGIALAYIDSRDLMERLDEVVGSGNWQNRYSHAEQKTVCEIGIRIDGEWIWKSNGAGDTAHEAEKGALSDAFKRAGVMWGVGRYLYDLQSPWVKLDDRENIDHSEMPKLRKLLEASAMPVGSMPNGVGQKSAHAARKDGKWDEVVNAMRIAPTGEELKHVAKGLYGEWIATLPENWQAELRDLYSERMDELKAKQAA